jgi:hypothetical protein
VEQLQPEYEQRAPERNLDPLPATFNNWPSAADVFAASSEARCSPAPRTLANIDAAGSPTRELPPP